MFKLVNYLSYSEILKFQKNSKATSFSFKNAILPFFKKNSETQYTSKINQFGLNWCQRSAKMQATIGIYWPICAPKMLKKKNLLLKVVVHISTRLLTHFVFRFVDYQNESQWDFLTFYRINKTAILPFSKVFQRLTLPPKYWSIWTQMVSKKCKDATLCYERYKEAEGIIKGCSPHIYMSFDINMIKLVNYSSHNELFILSI